jgi:7-cyano-7-deazaguanine synthase
VNTDLILLSGGLDSATLLADRAAAGTARLAVAVNYGQRHVVELRAAARLANHYDMPFTVLDLSSWGRLLGGSALTDRSAALPQQPSADQSPTIVPNRNATLLCAAAGIAQACGMRWVLTATHAGDHDVYPDCRQDFLRAIELAVELATEGRVGVDAPFSHLSKVAVVRRAAELGVPIEATWSCYAGGTVQCGRCGACTGRRAALAAAGIPDPTRYLAAAAA